MPNTSIPAQDVGYNVVQCLAKKVTFADNGVAKTVGVLPAGALVTGSGIVVTAAFNAGTSNVIDIGTSADDDGFGTDLALGNIVWDELATSNDLYQTAETTVTATVALSGTAATAGTGYVYVQYVMVR